MAQIQALSGQIARQFQPERIVLFGSYAYGTPTVDSDVDLLVILSFEGKSAAKSSEIRHAVHQGFPLDLLVYAPDTLQKRLAAEDFLLREIMDKGTTLYEAAHPSTETGRKGESNLLNY